MDAAASEFYNEEKGTYVFHKSDGRELTDEMVDYWANWIEKYPIASIEDGLHEDDWAVTNFTRRWRYGSVGR